MESDASAADRLIFVAGSVEETEMRYASDYRSSPLSAVGSRSRLGAGRRILVRAKDFCCSFDRDCRSCSFAFVDRDHHSCPPSPARDSHAESPVEGFAACWSS